MALESTAGSAASLEHSLQRDDAAGMNPTSILLGHGIKGEKLRHVVHEGALRLPKSALNIMDLGRKQQGKHTLPGLDSVARPSRDSSISDMTVTEIHGVVLPADPLNMLPERLQCYARNKNWADDKAKPEVERIRGGGEGEGDDAPAPAPATSEPTATDAESQSNDFQAEPVQADGEPMQVDSSEPKESSVTTEETSSDAVDPEKKTEALPEPTETPLVADPVPTPTTVSSSNPPVPASSRSLPEVLPLAVKPEPQWQQHAPGTLDANQPNPQPPSSFPDWFESNQVSQLESSMLSEWFDGSAVHRNEKSYLASRNRMIDMSNKLADRYVTTTMIRRSIPGDIGSLMRMYNFLTAYGLINNGSLNETAPTPVTLQESKTKYRWSEPLQQELLQAVVEESRKRQRLTGPSSQVVFEPTVDWDAVAKKLGHGVSPTDCERQFLAMPIADTPEEGAATAQETTMNDSSEVKGSKPTTDDSARSIVMRQQEMLQDVLAVCDAKVVRGITDAAFSAESGHNVAKTQRNAVIGLVTHHAIEEAKSRDEKVSRIMAEIVDARMKKLENRLALLDDVEGLLESERVALELERRDLYTARCRHWYGGI